MKIIRFKLYDEFQWLEVVSLLRGINFKFERLQKTKFQKAYGFIQIERGYEDSFENDLESKSITFRKI